MGVRDWFRPRVVEKVVHVHDSDRRSTSKGHYTGKTKFGNIRYQDAGWIDYESLRENARGVYNDSLIARSIIGRLIDQVVNTGLTLESTPLWSMIPEAPADDADRYAFTEQVEALWKLYADSREPDYHGRLTFRQLQRLVYRLLLKEGEVFAILHYMNSPERTNPLAIQILNNDQIRQPYDAQILEAAKARGAKIREGIEYDATGKMTAVYIAETADFGSKVTRVSTYGPRSKRRFLIHVGNFETADQSRGFPELSAMIYELDRLVEMDISELENSIASAGLMAFVETEKGAQSRGPVIKANVGTQNIDRNTEDGVRSVEMGKRALFMQNLAPGQSIKAYQPAHPNPNYTAFVTAFETKLADMWGMPLSVLHQKFQGSYSAARAEILFFWNNVFKRRDDIASGFLNLVYEAWFAEHVQDGNLSAPGFGRPMPRKAYTVCTWNGISRPVVDPVKEVNAVKTRLDLGHTTGEREAKAYNGSDFRENINRLKTENELRRDANIAIDPELAPDTETDDPPGGDE